MKYTCYRNGRLVATTEKSTEKKWDLCEGDLENFLQQERLAAQYGYTNKIKQVHTTHGILNFIKIKGVTNAQD